MACFITPTIVAVVTTILQRANRQLSDRLNLKALNTMLWGGSVLLAVEHALHGELAPRPPFLTAAPNISGILYEAGTTGILMALAVSTLWGSMVGISKLQHKLSTKGKAVVTLRR